MLREVLEFHAFCLTRTGTRLDEYAKAIDALIRPDDVVVDLGAGLGVLSVMACRRGARRVYAIESSLAAQYGRQLVRAAGLSDRITFLEGTSFDVDLPEPVDAIISDVHGPFGLQDRGLSAVQDACQRWLKPGGTTIPARVELLVAPVEAADVYARTVDVWQRTVQGLDVSPLRDVAVNLPYPGRFEPAELLAPMASVAGVDLARSTSPLLTGRQRFVATRRGTMHGLCGAGRSTLAANVVTSNAPGASDTTNYACLFLPLERPVSVQDGDAVYVDVASFDSTELRWVVTITRRATDAAEPFQQAHATERFEQATLYALPALPTSVRKTRADYTPTLTDSGRLEMEILSRFDGTHTVAQLREWLSERAPSTEPAAKRLGHLLTATIERCG